MLPPHGTPTNFGVLAVACGFTRFLVCNIRTRWREKERAYAVLWCWRATGSFRCVSMTERNRCFVTLSDLVLTVSRLVLSVTSDNISSRVSIQISFDFLIEQRSYLHRTAFEVYQCHVPYSLSVTSSGCFRTVGHPPTPGRWPAFRRAQ